MTTGGRGRGAPDTIVQHDVVVELTRAMWEAVLGKSADACPAPARALQGQRALTGLVRIRGAWHGAVTLTCNVGLAQRTAEAMLELPAGSASADHVRDAWGELANILGGDIKALVPGPSRLSLPLVVEGDGHDATEMDGSPTSELWFDCSGEILRVRIYTAHDVGTVDGEGRRQHENTDRG